MVFGSELTARAPRKEPGLQASGKRVAVNVLRVPGVLGLYLSCKDHAALNLRSQTLCESIENASVDLCDAVR